MMDTTDSQVKVEPDLGSETNDSSCRKSFPNHGFSPRVTRSRSNSGKRVPISEELDLTEIQPIKSQKKVDEVEKIYLNKKAKVVHKNLETIYEDPVCKKGNTVLLGTSKVKRSIYLDREFRITSKQKSKLRKMKIKRLGKKKMKPFKMSDDEFNSRMMRIENYINGDEVCDVQIDANDNNEDYNDLEIKSAELSSEEKSNGVD